MFKAILIFAMTIESGAYTDRSIWYEQNGTSQRIDVPATVKIGRLLIINKDDVTGQPLWTFIGEKRGSFWLGSWRFEDREVNGRFWITGPNRLEGEFISNLPGAKFRITTVLEKK